VTAVPDPADEAVNRRWLLRRRPTGVVSADDFDLVREPAPRPGPGEFLVRQRWLAFDAAQRVMMAEGTAYGLSVPIGGVMWGVGLGEVVESRHDEWAVGDVAHGWFGWQDLVVSTGRDVLGARVSRFDPAVDPTLALGVLGTTGLTAWFGLHDVGRPVAGETVLVTAAAGATGSVAAQLARIAGCRVIGTAGTPEKCAWLTSVARLDAAIDYRREDVGEALARLAPDGVHVCFDNVGGPVLDAVLPHLAVGGRVVACGDISGGYDDRAASLPGLRNLGVLPVKRGRIEGFIVGDFARRFDEARTAMAALVATGDLVSAVDVVVGFEQAPAALRRLFEGANLGKQVLLL
jgi:NADPH-dependent curcumin reductase CurA